MSQVFYQINSDQILIGTVTGSLEDAKLYVESQIEAHFDLPKKCSYRIKKEGGDIFHFEIHQGDSIGSILDLVTKAFEEDPEQDIFVFTPDDTQYQFYRRPDGSIRTFVRTESERVIPESEGSIEFIDGSPSKLKPFFSTLEVATWISGIAFGISFLFAVIAASAAATISVSESGYSSAIDKSPVSLFVSSGKAGSYDANDIRSLPSIDGRMALKRFTRARSEIVGKLSYDGDRWIVRPLEKQK